MSKELEELPDGWEQAALSEVCEPIKQVNPGKTPEFEFRYVDISSINNTTHEIVETKEYTGENAPSRARKPIRINDILFATVRPYLKNIALVLSGLDGQIASTGFCVLRAGPRIDSRFLFYYVLTDNFVKQVSEAQRGISYPAVTDRNVYSLPINFPWSLPEQRRIVAKIDKLLVENRTALAALGRVPPLLKKFRQAVLAKAFRGQLTERNPQDEPAAVLLARIEAERQQRASGKKYVPPAPPDTRDLPELPEGWVYVSLESLLSIARAGMKTGPFGTLLKKQEHQKEGVPVLGIENIGEMQFLPGSKIHITKEKANELSEYAALPGDVLISRSGTVGEVCIVPEGIGEARISTNIIRVVLQPETMLGAFFGYLFNGPTIVLDQVNEMCKGTTRAFLNQRILGSVVFPLPPLAEQRRIVATIEALFAQATAIEQAVASAQARAAKIEQAVLARAFRGAL